jgi:hypothetical protein
MVLALEREPRQERRWGQIVARAWEDDAFRRRLLAEPERVLREEGIDVPAGAAIRVIEGASADAGEAETCFWLPPVPADQDLIEDDLGLPPGAFDGGPGIPTKFSKPAKASGSAPPTRPAAGDLIEDDLGLPPDVFDGVTGFPTRFPKPTKISR